MATAREAVIVATIAETVHFQFVMIAIMTLKDRDIRTRIIFGSILPARCWKAIQLLIATTVAIGQFWGTVDVASMVCLLLNP